MGLSITNNCFKPLSLYRDSGFSILFLSLHGREGGFIVRPSRPVSIRGAMGRRRMTLPLPVGPLACERSCRRAGRGRTAGIQGDTRPGCKARTWYYPARNFNCLLAWATQYPARAEAGQRVRLPRCRPADGAHGKLSRPRSTVRGQRHPTVCGCYGPLARHG